MTRSEHAHDSPGFHSPAGTTANPICTKWRRARSKIRCMATTKITVTVVRLRAGPVLIK